MKDHQIGPFYYGVLQSGNVYQLARKPRVANYVEEFIVTIDKFGQHKWHFLTTKNGYKCDFESRCGYDRGPRLDILIGRMINK